VVAIIQIAEFILSKGGQGEEYVFTKEKKGIEIARKIKDDIEAIKIGIDAEKDSILFLN